MQNPRLSKNWIFIGLMTEFFSGCSFLNVKVVLIVFFQLKKEWHFLDVILLKTVSYCCGAFFFWIRPKKFDTKFQRFDQKVLLFASVFQTECLQSRNSVFRFCFRAFIWDPVAWWRCLVVTGTLSLRPWYGVSYWYQFGSKKLRF